MTTFSRGPALPAIGRPAPILPPIAANAIGGILFVALLSPAAVFAQVSPAPAEHAATGSTRHIHGTDKPPAFGASLRDVSIDAIDSSRLHADSRSADAEVSAAALPIRPKSKANWYRLSALQPGQVISVDVAGKRRMTGRLISVDDTSVTLETIHGTQRVDRMDVLRVTAAATRRLKVAGFVTAAGLGLMIAHLASTSTVSEPLPTKFSLAGLPTALIGVTLVGKERPRTGLIYRKP